MKIVEIYKNTALIFNLLKAGFLLLCFAIYKMLIVNTIWTSMNM